MSTEQNKKTLLTEVRLEVKDAYLRFPAIRIEAIPRERLLEVHDAFCGIDGENV